MSASSPHPKLREDMLRVRLVERGETLYMYKVLESGNYYRIDEIQDQILGLLDGTRSPEEIVEEFNARNLAMSIDLEFFGQFYENLRESEIFEKTPEEKKVLILEKIRDQRRWTAANKRVFGNILDIKLTAWNPDPFFTWLLPYIRFIWTPGFVIFSIACILVMLGIWIAKWTPLMIGTIELFTFQGKTGADILQFFLILLVIGFIHESAHGMTCKYFGGYVPQMGFMLIFLGRMKHSQSTPCQTVRYHLRISVFDSPSAASRTASDGCDRKGTLSGAPRKRARRAGMSA